MNAALESPPATAHLARLETRSLRRQLSGAAIASALALTVGVVACGDAADPGANNGSAEGRTGVVGHVFAGDVEGVKITASTEQGEVLGTADVGPGGLFGFDFGARHGAVVLTTAGGTSVDLATGTKKPLPALRTLVPMGRQDQPACVAQVSPMTELASKLKDRGKSWADSTGLVTYLSAGGDAFCSPPVDPTKTQAAPSAQTEVGIAMAGVASLAEGKGKSLDAALGDVATAIVSNDQAVLADYAGATEGFLSGPLNKTSLDAKQSAVPSLAVLVGNPVAIPIHLIVPACGSTVTNNPAVPALGTVRTVACAKPDVTAANVTVRTDVPRPPAGSKCAIAKNPDECTDGEIDRCAGAYCVQAIRPAASRKVWKMCHWFTSPAECPGGTKVVTKDKVDVPKACPADGCDPQIVLVLPGNHNIDGSLIIHEKQREIGFFQTAFDVPGPPRFEAGESCPGGGTACEQVALLFLSKGEGSAARTISFMTTYGFEWTMTFRGSRAAGARTFCDVFTGVCVPEVAASPVLPGTCSSVCERIAACSPDKAAQLAACTTECEEKKATRTDGTKGRTVQAFNDMLDCCMQDVDCDRDGRFDPCYKTACGAVF